jgi:RNA polymerase sigma-70 factor (ECF subfamily)
MGPICDSKRVPSNEGQESLSDRTRAPAETNSHPIAGRGSHARDRERALVDAVLAKNRKAAAEFVALLSDPVYRYVRYRLTPRHDVIDDLVQEVFLAAWDNLGSFRGASSLKTWIIGIARHKVETYYRRELRRHLSFDSDDDHVPDVAEDPALEVEMDRKRALAVTVKILGDMPEAYRLLLRWRYWDKRSLAEIGGDLGKSEKAIERALARARAEFKRRWNDG